MMTAHKRYVVMHNWGSEGWKIVSEHDTITDACYAREDDLANGGGEVVIFEFQHPLSAYAQSHHQGGRP